MCGGFFFFFFSSRRRHTRWTGDWSSDVCSSDLERRRLRAEQRQRDTHEEGDRGDRVLAILGGLLRVVAKLPENRPRRLRDEQDPLPPRSGSVRMRPVSRDAHAWSVWDALY